MKALKRFLGFFLCLALLLPMIPTEILAVDEHEVYTLSDKYIKVDVSRVNGGFLISTEEGDRLKKSDNNKKLLYHDGQYDTSFVSFRVGEGTDAKDFIFGGKYTGSTAVTVTKSADKITASWGVKYKNDNITFTQTFALAAQNSNENGMVSISVSVSGTSEPVKARILLDTCLGTQDYAYYRFTDRNGGSPMTETVETEKLLTGPNMSISNFYAIDSVADPSVFATMASTPDRVAVGHWNHLASTLYDFDADDTLSFTNPINEYMTADSACALYYDSLGATNPVSLYYGVYSNWAVLDSDRVAVNATAPLRLELERVQDPNYTPNPNIPNDPPRMVSVYKKSGSVLGIADFSAHVVAENYFSESARDYENVQMVVSTSSNLRPLNDNGQAETDFNSGSPLIITKSDFKVNDRFEKDLYFQARVLDNASYERITISFYDNSTDYDPNDPLGTLPQDKLLGQKVIYILLPGSDGGVPLVHFTSMSPKTVYIESTRHLYVGVANSNLMQYAILQGMMKLFAVSADGKQEKVLDENAVTFNDGIADVVIDDSIKLSVGTWHLELRWEDQAVEEKIVTSQYQKQTSQVLNFEVSADPKYRNDCYGVLAALKYNPAPDEYKYVLKAFKDEEEFTAFCAKDDSGKYKQDPDLKEILLVFRGAFVGDMRYPVTENGKVVGYRYYSAVSKETIKDGKATVDQTVTINNCLDFEAGTMSVYYENYKGTEAAAKNSAILCEFDGKLYTSVERTSVWTGMAALTKLEQGQYKNFGLIHYNHFGERVSSQATPITLIWPNIYSYGQKLAGMVFKLAYGQFGYMEKDGKELGRVVAFSASLNLSFMKSPQQEDDTAVPDTYFGRMKELWTDWRGASLYQYAYHGNRFNKLTDINMNDSKEDHDKAQEGVAASVMVPDILFGCGKGFVGLHFKVELAIQNMIDSLPKIKGSLEVNTIGDWSFGLDGMCKLSTFSLEASLKFKSKDNIPIPDELFFFVSVPKPGTNIDGCGTLWLLGAGGGVSNIYDTIFMTSGVPPLKLILQASFSIVQILDAKARLELSLTALKLTATDLKFAGTIEVIRSITLGLQWYPDLNLQASIYVDMFEKTISGNGYIVLIGKNYKEWEFEMFARVRLKIPESVPAVGGMTLLGIDVGIGTKKVWGAFEAICVSLGVSYYWGEKGVRFGTGGNFAQPSYPNLLTQGYDGDCTDFPIGYDPEEDRILYARFGTNLDPPVGARILSDDALLLQGAGDPAIGSNMTKTLHKINVGEYDADNNASALVQVSFPAADLDAAKAIAGTFTLKDSSENELSLTYAQDVPEQGANESDEDYEDRVALICTANMAANANISYSDGTATLGFTLTDSNQFNKDWYLTTGTVNAGTGEIESGVAADVVMYNVRPLPGITSLDATIEVDGNSNKYVDLTLSGNYGDLDKISFYLTKGNTEPLEDGIPLGVYDDLRYPPMLYLPVDLPTGDYYVRAVYSAEDLVNGVVWSSNTIHYDNPNTPAAMGTVTAAPCGDLKYGVTIPATDDANTTGYIVEVLNADGTPTELSETRVDKADDGKATVFEVGGAISMEVAADPGNPDSGKETVTQGLTAGQSYKLRITPYKAIEAKEPIYEYDTYNNIEVVSEPGNNAAVLYGNSFTTEAMSLPEPQPPVVTVTCGDQTLTSVAQAQKLDKADGTLNALTFTGSSLTLTVASNQAVTGKWTLDGSEVWGLDGNEAADAPADLNREGTFTDQNNVTITLPNLTEGSHLLTLFGKNAAGDSFAAEYAFDVDTMPPRLMLQSPLNGSPFNADGTVTVSGITDPDCTVHVSVDGGAESTYLFKDPQDTSGSKKLTEDGYFTVDADIPEANSSSFHFVEVWAEDANGNATEHSIIEVSHPGFGKIEEYVLKVDGAIPLGGGISTGNAIAAAQLTLAGKLTEGGEVSYFTINSDLVQWQCYAAEGSASVTPDGILTCDAYTKGYVEARVEVTSGAYRTAVLALGSDTIFGDLNGDNRVNTMDLVRLIKYILANMVDPQQTSVVLEASGDLNGDGKTNTQDLVQLKKYLLFENAI